MYAHNNRPGRRARGCEAGWDPAIANLVERDYAFLPLTYADDGYLFRGLDGKLEDSLASGTLGLNAGPHGLAALEREAGVLFVSADLSDALAVSRLWENPAGSAIAVLSAARFADAHAAGRAAVLGFADPGVVFRYPFVIAPWPIEALAGLIVHPARLAGLRETAGPFAPLLTSPAVVSQGDQRTVFERALAEHCARSNWNPAREAAGRQPRPVSA